MGTKFLARNKDTLMDNVCPYRICQDGILSMFPYMTKRKIKCTANDFKFFLSKTSFKHDEILNSGLKEEIKNLNQGGLVLFSEKDENIQDLDCLVCLNFKESISIMASKELLESFKIRYQNE